MVKKIFILLICTCSLIANNENSNELTTAEKVIIGGVIGTAVVAATVVAAPLILSSGTIAAIKTALGAAAVKASAAGATIKTATTAAAVNASVAGASVKSAVAVAAPIAGKVSIGLGAIQLGTPYLRPHIAPASEDKLNKLVEEEASEILNAHKKLNDCIISNKDNPESGMPTACQDAARMFAMIVGQDELKIQPI
ncbi:hypothetical protein HYX58_01895 [Candidatus Dependentiae bacterium]|nr:hypothetical protein [Candidatus Dependentiae bacterium]